MTDKRQPERQCESDDDPFCGAEVRRAFYAGVGEMIGL
jgi:hypothetical protein